MSYLHFVNFKRESLIKVIIFNQIRLFPNLFKSVLIIGLTGGSLHSWRL